MDPFEELRIVALSRNRDGEFPDWLMQEIVSVADAPDHYGGNPPLVEMLVAQIREYDAATEYFERAVSMEVIVEMIRRMKRG